MKQGDAAFFANTAPEHLLSTDDPGDQPLLTTVPVVLTERFVRLKAIHPLAVKVRRNGMVRLSVPVPVRAKARS